MLPNQRAGFLPRTWSKGFFRGLRRWILSRRRLESPRSPFWMGHEAIIRWDRLTIWAGSPGGPASAENRGAFPALNATVAYSTRGPQARALESLLRSRPIQRVASAERVEPA